MLTTETIPAPSRAAVSNNKAATLEQLERVVDGFMLAIGEERQRLVLQHMRLKEALEDATAGKFSAAS